MELDEILEDMSESDELDFIKHAYHGHTTMKFEELPDFQQAEGSDLHRPVRAERAELTPYAFTHSP